MQDYKVYKFNELGLNQNILKNTVLILGNGASISVNDCFYYDSLYARVCKNGMLGPNSMELFKVLETTDFELVLNKLRQASIINKALNVDNNNIALKMYDNIRNALINAVKETHVKFNDVILQINNIKNFMGQFKTVISLNYDLLVYWAIMDSNYGKPHKLKDCFTKNIGNGNMGFEYDIKKLRKPYKGVSDPTLVFYPHGNLMLATNANNEEFKIKLSTQNNLFKEISDKWGKNYVPLFVSEGNSKQKLTAIKRSSYLDFIYENILVDLGKVAVVYGWKLAKQEKYLINKIFHKNGIEQVFISIYLEDKSSVDDIKAEQDQIISLLKRRKIDIEIKFFDVSSKIC